MNVVQLQALNKILQNKDTTLLNKFSVSYFSDLPQEYTFIKTHYDDTGTIPDMETFLQKFIQFNVIEVNEPSEYLSERLIEDKTRLDLTRLFSQVRDALNNGDVKEAKRIFDAASITTDVDDSLHVVNILEDTSRYDAFVDKSLNFANYYVSTGFPEIDKIVGGWDRNEELATIVARGGVGKSWFLLKSALAAATSGLRVGLFSGEMTDTKVGYRIDTLDGHISNFALTKGNTSIMNEYKEFIDSYKDRIKGPLFVLTPTENPLSVLDLKKFIRDYTLDILFVDQHSLLEDSKHASNPIQAASNISKDLKNLQVSERIPIISASQQNRADTEERGVSLKNISQTDRIGQDSTLVIFIEQKDGIMTLHIVKSRDSESGKAVRYMVNLDKGMFQYIPTEEDSIEDVSVSNLDIEENVFD